MSRPNWKMLFFSKSMWRYLLQKKKRNYVIYNRATTIPALFKSKNVKLHQGKYTRHLKILNYSRGFKFGEFGFTKHPFYFPYIEKKKKR